MSPTGLCVLTLNAQQVALLRGCETFRRQGLAGGSNLRVGGPFEGLLPI